MSSLPGAVAQTECCRFLMLCTCTKAPVQQREIPGSWQALLCMLQALQVRCWGGTVHAAGHLPDSTIPGTVLGVHAVPAR